MKRVVENHISSSADSLSSLSRLTLGLHAKRNLLAVAATCWNVNKSTSALICRARLLPKAIQFPMLSFNAGFYPSPCIPNTRGDEDGLRWKTQKWRAQWRSEAARVTGDPPTRQQTAQINCFMVHFFSSPSPSHRFCPGTRWISYFLCFLLFACHITFWRWVP